MGYIGGVPVQSRLHSGQPRIPPPDHYSVFSIIFFLSFLESFPGISRSTLSFSTVYRFSAEILRSSRPLLGANKIPAIARPGHQAKVP